MVKLIACGLIIAVGWFCGDAYAESKKKNYRELCGVIALLETMKNSISYSKTELYGIFAAFSDKALNSCGFMEVLKSQDRLPASELWQTALEKLSVDGRIKEVLSSFGSTLGLLDGDTQLERLDGCVSFLEKEREAMYSSLSQKLKSYRYLGALIGCLAAIILY